jgi:two-component system, NarL family, invasion response regulator UvrY
MRKTPTETPEKAKIRVLIADDHDLFRSGLKMLLEGAEDIEVVAEATDGRAAVAEFERTSPDVCILDITMPILDGLDACKQIKSLNPRARVLILTMHPEEQYAVRLLNAGALGYVTKKISDKELHAAVRSVYQGEITIQQEAKDRILAQLLHMKGRSGPLEVLSDREAQVFILLAQGNKLKDISQSLNLSPKTVEHYRSNIFDKLELKRTIDLVSFAHRHNLL